jgi:orotate phosphoribosyltransferase
MTYREDFIEFMVRSSVLLFGDFETKSGRRTPYFVDTGRYSSGSQLAALGGFYASLIVERFAGKFDVLFGPAYKGIPLVVATASQLYLRHGLDCATCFNRKEQKDHGEGGRLIGHTLRDGDRILIIEDVTTAGTSLRETIPLLREAAAVELAGLVVSVDRMERGKRARSAFSEVQEEYGFPAHAIVTLRDIIAHLHGRSVDGRVVLDDEVKARLDDYIARYGAP